MKEVIEINIYDKRANSSTTICVEKLSENVFKAVKNEIFNCRLTLGTEFEARLNNDGFYEIVRIIEDSEYTTRRFILTSQFTESEYRLLGDEIIRLGGFWQTDFGSIVTINLPRNCKLNLDAIFKEFDFHPVEIKD
ncbi:hypothetical protein [Rhizosphaericola mali]|uniref:DUF4265 domain-containing protein n=1 Tax=Rhizosphaericola mali TaxID=2545455 RepID=A0A5P2FY99_9BACT|nr:hypothetical protein [Rhizosphaericola mali]QES87358.1 hypothetical protein E0W69_001345 [Rhizosphaericola mali]